jgi:hypothetical protein
LCGWVLAVDALLARLAEMLVEVTERALPHEFGRDGIEPRSCVVVEAVLADVAFYGSSPNLEDVPRIKAALLIQSAELDERMVDAAGALGAARRASDSRLRYGL